MQQPGLKFFTHSIPILRKYIYFLLQAEVSYDKTREGVKAVLAAPIAPHWSVAFIYVDI